MIFHKKNVLIIKASCFLLNEDSFVKQFSVYFNSGLHVFQFSSDYSPLHEELTEKKKTEKKTKISSVTPVA